MANGIINMLDIAKRQNNEIALGIIEECLKDIPEFESLPFRTIAGTSFKTYRRTGFAHGSFRRINEGVESSKNEGEQIEVECFPFDSNIEIDELANDADDSTLGNLLSSEGSGLMQGNLFKLATQIYKGTAEDKNGFSGFIENVSDSMVVKAATSGTGLSSVWFVYRGLRGVSLIGGKNTALNVSKPERVYIQDSDGKKHWGYNSNMSGWYGLQIAHSKAIGRLCNVADTLTDEMLTELYYKFPSWMRPNAIYMNSESARKLHKSRAQVASLNAGSASVSIKGDYNAARPTDFLGIPIYVTDAIDSLETLVS